MGRKQRRNPAVPPGIRAALPGILLVMVLGSMDQTVMAAALPPVAGDLHGLDQMSAIITGYLVAATTRFAGSVSPGLAAGLGERMNPLTPRVPAELPASSRAAVRTSAHADPAPDPAADESAVRPFGRPADGRGAPDG